MRAMELKTGSVFGKLTVISREGSDRYGASMWRCRCECGNETKVRGQSLKNGDIRSCGCSKETAQGKYDTGSYRSWKAMMFRCTNPKSKSYKRFGGRGIKVCESWQSFSGFFADMGERPAGAEHRARGPQDGGRVEEVLENVGEALLDEVFGNFCVSNV